MDSCFDRDLVKSAQQSPAPQKINTKISNVDSTESIKKTIRFVERPTKSLNVSACQLLIKIHSYRLAHQFLVLNLVKIKKN